MSEYNKAFRPVLSMEVRSKEQRDYLEQWRFLAAGLATPCAIEGMQSAVWLPEPGRMSRFGEMPVLGVVVFEGCGTPDEEATCWWTGVVNDEQLQEYDRGAEQWLSQVVASLEWGPQNLYRSVELLRSFVPTDQLVSQ